MGLMKAVEKFEYRRDTSFPPTPHVDSSGHHALHADQARTIRIPVHMIETINSSCACKQTTGAGIRRENLRLMKVAEEVSSQRSCSGGEGWSVEPITMSLPERRRDSPLWSHIIQRGGETLSDMTAMFLLKEKIRMCWRRYRSPSGKVLEHDLG